MSNYLTSSIIQSAKKQNQTKLDLNDILGREKIKTVPKEIFNLTGLKMLLLANNDLEELPESISNLVNLEILVLWGNQFTSLPDSISKLSKLRILSLVKNKFTVLPDSLMKLSNLEWLDLQDNSLTSLPPEIMKMERLKEIKLGGNPLVIPPIEIATRGIRPIREYFRQLYYEGQDNLYEAKLLILGEGGAGKTTLAQKLVNSSYQLVDEKSTEGVDVLQWSFPIENDRSFRINIWDFGGQEIYHSTHQFFLTKRSLYVLVADTRKEDTDFYYWLNVVELLSENSPLLIIKNEKQDRHREINERQLRGQFENLKEVIPVNLATNRGLDNLFQEIQHYAKLLPHVGSPLPKTWVRVREALERDSHDFISLDEYFNICRQNGFAKVKDSIQLSGYLHDIGVFLHFQDDPLLRKTVILKPKWGTDAAYRVLDNKKVIRNLGRFTRADLIDIWDTAEYANMHDELLQLMIKFKLCYQIPSTSDVFIAPQLLTENQPSYSWNDNENLLLRYTYEFMPKGILMQFIVAMHQNIAMVNKQSVVWKSGVVVLKDQTAAEIIEHYGKRQVYVRISGAHKKELMTIIMHELDKIHSTYRRLKYDKLIPCNCSECKKKLEPYFYRYEILQKFIEDRQDQIQCQQSYKMVDVRGLIDDVITKEYIREERGAPMAQYIIHGDYIDQGDKKMADNKISINNSTIHGSVVAAERIKDSFNVIEKANIKDDLKEQLKQLNQAVEVMIAGLSKEKAEEVADDMKRLAEEAVKPSPSKKWYSVSVDGLTKAAENLGKIGEPVIKLAGKVLALLATV